ncbi:MAG: hypothetical protein Q9220_004787 [cf. Caloplaca sp. 1 TL-2023]
MSQLDDVANIEDDIELDKLCDLCASLFDDKVIWKDDLYQEHHDIVALANSAAHGCHLCSLILDQIKPEDVAQLQRDLVELVISPSQQIGINISGKYGLVLTIATGSVEPSQGGIRGWVGGWFPIEELSMQFEEYDYTNRTRSKSVLNCSDASMVQITSWLDQCMTRHKKCSEVQTVATTRNVLPKRLLDVSSAERTGRLKLVSTLTMPPRTSYVTLSHCWGGQCAAKLVVDNLETFENGVQVSVLPKTFRDAITLTAKLNVHYLWIDALCIVQDAPDGREWRHEACIMGDIYANSYVTLAATVSENSNGGLLHRRSRLSVWPCRVTANWTCFPRGRLVVGVGQWTRETDMKPLVDRAWAFQEWLLSKRLIHFSHDQVRWECYCLSASQVYPEGHSGLDEHDRDDHGISTKGIIVSLSDDDSTLDAFGLWGRIREEYSAKRLTECTDKLTAFSGIARMAHKVLKSLPEEYCAGLWRPMLLPELLWERFDVEARRQPSKTYIAPTWSWASLDGEFWWGKHDSVEKGEWLIEVIDIRIGHVDDTFGPVTGGCLVVRCNLCSVTLTVMEHRTNYGETRWELVRINGAPVKYNSSTNLDHHEPEGADLASELTCYFMPMRGTDKRASRPQSGLLGMLLKPTKLPTGQYHRIGLLTVYNTDGSPNIKDTIVQGKHCSPDKSYPNSPKNGPDLIEIV